MLVAVVVDNFGDCGGSDDGVFGDSWGGGR